MIIHFMQIGFIRIAMAFIIFQPKGYRRHCRTYLALRLGRLPQLFWSTTNYHRNIQLDWNSGLAVEVGYAEKSRIAGLILIRISF